MRLCLWVGVVGALLGLACNGDGAPSESGGAVPNAAAQERAILFSRKAPIASYAPGDRVKPTDHGHEVRPWVHTHGGHGHGHGKPHRCDDDTAPPPSCGWLPYADGLAGANIGALEFEPQSGAAYVAAGGILWRSSDRGQSWTAPSAGGTSGIRGLAIDPLAPDRLLAATNTGLQRSTDSGASWQNAALSGLVLNEVALAPSRPLRVYAAGQGTGVFRSDDGGRSFTPTGFGYPFGATLRIDVSPSLPDEVVAVVRTIGSSGGWLSDGSIALTRDGGTTWSKTAFGVAVHDVKRCAADPSVLAAATGGGVAQSRDGGATWELRAVPTDSTSEVLGVAYAGTSCESFYVVQADIGVKLTVDGGVSYTAASRTGLEVVLSRAFPGHIAVDPRQPGSVLLATSGALYRSDDYGRSWAIVRDIRWVIGSALASAANDGTLWLGTWGSGIFKRAAQSSAWQRVPIADLPADYAMSISVDPRDSDRVFVGSWGPLFSSEDGATFQTQSDVTPNALTSAFARDPRGVVYVGTQIGGVFKSDDDGRTFSPANGNLVPWGTPAGPAIDVRALVLNHDDSSVVYAATLGRGVLKSIDGGASWQSVLGPTSRVPCMVGARGDMELFACEAGVMRSQDGGVTWTDFSAGLPTLDVAALVFDDAADVLYAATGYGVFARNVDDPSFQPVDTACLPSAGTLTITQRGSKRTLVVAAGGGVYARRL
jgi:photosystem II stability/assembly factor-like uncharacterized protein